MTTIKDVARIAGVSVATVSRVVNNPDIVVLDKRKAVEKVMAELNYKPNALARALVSMKTNSIGLLVGELGSTFFSQMMVGIDKVIVDAGKHVVITSGYHEEKQEERAINFLVERQCDGLIIHAKAVSDDFLIRLAEGSTPIVIINRFVPGLEDRCIYLDNTYGAYLATQYLISQSHQDIAFLCTNLGKVSDGEERLKGYRNALEEAGIEFRESMVARAFPDEAGGSKAVAELLSRNIKFTAVFGYSDQMIAGAMNTLEDNGIQVPGQVSMVGFDDIVTAQYLRPRLTTVRYPISEMGVVAAKKVLNFMEPDDHPVVTEPLKFKPELIERRSVVAEPEMWL